MFRTPWTSSLRSPGGLFATYGNFAREMGADQWFSSEIRADVLVGPRGSGTKLFESDGCSFVVPGGNSFGFGHCLGWTQTTAPWLPPFISNAWPNPQ